MTTAATAVWGRAEQQDFRARVRGCLLGGAIGDALGARVAGLTLDDIRAAHGPDGSPTSSPPYGRRGAVTAATQLTLFTVDGLIRAQVRRDTGAWHPPTDVHRAYLRWAATQRDWGPDERRKDNGWLAREEWLYARRDPYRACLTGLGDETIGTLDTAQEPDRARRRRRRALRAVRPARGLGAAAGLPARRGVRGADPRPPHRVSLGRGLRRHRARAGPRRDRSTAPSSAPSRCCRPPGPPARDRRPPAGPRRRTPGHPGPARIAALGDPEHAEDALAVAVYCALVGEDIRHGLRLAVNHDGPSDATGDPLRRPPRRPPRRDRPAPRLARRAGGPRHGPRTRRRLRHGDDPGPRPPRPVGLRPGWLHRYPRG